MIRTRHAEPARANAQRAATASPHRTHPRRKVLSARMSAISGGEPAGDMGRYGEIWGDFRRSGPQRERTVGHPSQEVDGGGHVTRGAEALEHGCVHDQIRPAL